ncbi:MAG: phosphoribosylformimino-5-aminoimidazole carboxamide ribotide isomerase [Verrucomicrobiota bacterium]|jgi:phosphoribosylformimino-5-aminoimidazole carboxamide ribotide isomerase|nr:phosphoribosylformimino-5-aminoimidazole carboxamide ribotide isomerase [Verrucomicrobiota bacterium]
MFRPCIDLHNGQVKQIVGGTLTKDSNQLKTNFVSERSSAWYAELYRRDRLRGGHVIQLGPGNTEASLEALKAFPGGLQVGGGIRASNARAYLEEGASHVIVTSWIFEGPVLRQDRLHTLVETVGVERLVLDLSCRIRDGSYYVVTDRWQTFTQLRLSREVLTDLANHCAEFLVHGVDVEGLCAGVDLDLVRKLADWSPIPVTYAGGARVLEDLETVHRESNGRVDLTIGSALDIFGGTGVTYREAVDFNRRKESPSD